MYTFLPLHECSSGGFPHFFASKTRAQQGHISNPTRTSVRDHFLILIENELGTRVSVAKGCEETLFFSVTLNFVRRFLLLLLRL